MAGAGLPASQGLAAIEPVTLLASGFQVLVLVPVTLAFLMVAVQVDDDLAASPRKPRTVVVLGHGRHVVTELVIVLAALYAAIVPMALVLGLFAAAAGSAALVAVVVAAFAATVPLALGIGLPRIVGRDPLSGPRIRQGNRLAAVPLVLRAAFGRVGGIGRRGLAIATALTLAPLAILAFGSIADRSIQNPRLPAGVYVASWVALWLVFAGVLLAVAGALLLRTAVTRDVAEAARRAAAAGDDRDTRCGGSTAAEERARSSVSVAIALIVALFVLPQSLGVLVVSMMLMALFADKLATGRPLRILALALVFVLGLMAYQAHTPQRFDRLEFSVAQEGSPQPRRVRVGWSEPGATRTWSRHVIAGVPRSSIALCGGPREPCYCGSPRAISSAPRS